MNLKKFSLILIFLFCLLIFQVSSQEFKGFNDLNLEFLKNDLNLNEKQEEKIRIILFDFMRQVKEKHIDLERANLDLKEELLKNSADLSKIKSIIDKKFAILGDMELIGIKRDLLIKSLLTAEQLIKWETVKRPGPHRFSGNPLPPSHQDKNFKMDPKEQEHHRH